MPLKDIMVHLDRGPGCTARFMAAIELARRHNACLKGIYIVSHPYYAPQSTLEGDYNEVRSFFINAASKSGVVAEWLYVDWNVMGTPINEMLTFHTYFTDLLIVGQPREGRKPGRGKQDLIEHLIRGTGRPVVVFPSDGNTFQFGTQVLIAWKAGRESVRAVHDAIPLLKKATGVCVMAVVSGEGEREREEAGLTFLHEYLARHGIDARITMTSRKGRSLADTLLDRAKEENADTIVMGGFTNSSRGFPIFCEVSRELIEKMTIPILLSH